MFMSFKPGGGKNKTKQTSAPEMTPDLAVTDMCTVLFCRCVHREPR